MLILFVRYKDAGFWTGILLLYGQVKSQKGQYLKSASVRY